RPHLHGAVFFPSKESGVEGPRSQAIVRGELIPAASARSAERRTGWRFAQRTLEEEEGRSLRIFNGGKPAHGRNIHRRKRHLAARLLDAECIGIHVIDADEADPA